MNSMWYLLLHMPKSSKKLLRHLIGRAHYAGLYPSARETREEGFWLIPWGRWPQDLGKSHRKGVQEMPGSHKASQMSTDTTFYILSLLPHHWLSSSLQFVALTNMVATSNWFPFPFSVLHTNARAVGHKASLTMSLPYLQHKHKMPLKTSALPIDDVQTPWNGTGNFLQCDSFPSFEGKRSKKSWLRILQMSPILSYLFPLVPTPLCPLE